jgi:5-formyltetrahydrofolate cyclo-ligase
MIGLMQTKDTLRANYKNLRKEVQNKAELEEKVRFLLFSRIMMHRFTAIHIYLSTPEELGTSSFIQTLLRDFSPEIYVPKVLPNNELQHVHYKPGMIINTSKWDIPEPSDEGISSKAFFNKFETEDILIICPLLAFDKEGQRLGYGGGYYDRFLANKTQKTTVIGLSFFEVLEQNIPETHHLDIKLDFCVSPARVYTFKK